MANIASGRSSSGKVLLVYPGEINSSTKRMPLSVLYLAESLLAAGYKPVIWDMQVDRFSPEMAEGCVCAGVSTLTGKQIRFALDAAATIRESAPGLPIVWGGIHPSTMAEQTLSHPLVDCVVLGEGEETFPELVRALEAGSPLRGIRGVAFKENGAVVVNPSRPFIDFNRYNNLPYELLSLDKYQTHIHFEYQSSRGCPFGCFFCYNKEFNHFRWRAKDSRIVLDELEALKKRFGFAYLYLVDDEFFIDQKRALEITRGMIERKLDFKWKPAIRVDMVNRFDAEFFDTLKRSGCFEFCMGAESGSDRILKYINKKITRADIIRSAHHTIGIGITPQYSFMAGFPGETIEDLHLTVSCITELWRINERILVNGLFQATPFPGTGLFEQVVKDRTVPIPATLEDWGDTDVFLAKTRKKSHLSPAFQRELRLYSAMIYFFYIWMHSKNYVRNVGSLRNAKTGKYWKFRLFHLLFSPLHGLLRSRWARKDLRWPADIHFVRLIMLFFHE